MAEVQMMRAEAAAGVVETPLQVVVGRPECWLAAMEEELDCETEEAAAEELGMVPHSRGPVLSEAGQEALH